MTRIECPECGCPRADPSPIPNFSGALHRLADAYSLNIKAYNRLLLAMWTVCIVAWSQSGGGAGDTAAVLGFTMLQKDLLTFSLILICLLSIALSSSLTQMHLCRKVYIKAVEDECEGMSEDGYAGERLIDIAHTLYHPGLTRVYPIARSWNEGPSVNHKKYVRLFLLVSFLVLGLPIVVAWKIVVEETLHDISQPPWPAWEWLSRGLDCWRLLPAGIATWHLGWRWKKEFELIGVKSKKN